MELAAVNTNRATTNRTARNAGDTHWCQWSADDGFRCRYGTLNTRDRELRADFRAYYHDRHDQQDKSRGLNYAKAWEA